MGLSPYTRDDLTPVSWAAKGGHGAVVKMLLEWGDAVFPTVRGLPRAPDGTGRLAVVRPVRPKGRTAVFR